MDLWKKHVAPVREDSRKNVAGTLSAEQNSMIMQELKAKIADLESGTEVVVRNSESIEPDAIIRRAKISPSDPCICGSGRAYKDCCLRDSRSGG